MRFLPDSHNRNMRLIGEGEVAEAAKIAYATQLGNAASGSCTKFRQAPVDELQSIENKRDRVAKIILTSPIGGVKHTRSSTSFQVLRS